MLLVYTDYKKALDEVRRLQSHRFDMTDGEMLDFEKQLKGEGKEV